MIEMLYKACILQVGDMWKEKTKPQECDVFIIIKLLQLVRTCHFKHVKFEGHLGNKDWPLQGGSRGDMRQEMVILKEIIRVHPCPEFNQLLGQEIGSIRHQGGR